MNIVIVCATLIPLYNDLPRFSASCEPRDAPAIHVTLPEHPAIDSGRRAKMLRWTADFMSRPVMCQGGWIAGETGRRGERAPVFAASACENWRGAPLP